MYVNELERLIKVKEEGFHCCHSSNVLIKSPYKYVI